MTPNTVPAELIDLLFTPPTMNTLDTTPEAAKLFAALTEARMPEEESDTLRAETDIEDALRTFLPSDLMRRYVRYADALAAQATAERDTAYELGLAIGRRLARQEVR